MVRCVFLCYIVSIFPLIYNICCPAQQHTALRAPISGPPRWFMSDGISGQNSLIEPVFFPFLQSSPWERNRVIRGKMMRAKHHGCKSASFPLPTGNVWGFFFFLFGKKKVMSARINALELQVHFTDLMRRRWSGFSRLSLFHLSILDTLSHGEPRWGTRLLSSPLTSTRCSPPLDIFA